MKRQRSSYRMIRKRTIFLSLVLLFLLALCIAGALRARMLLGLALDGRREVIVSEPERDAYSGFRLREQMNSAQAAVRVNGWLTLADIQNVELRTQRGTLRASLYDAIGGKDEVPYAIVLHGGAGSDRMQVQDIACELSLNGYRVLTPDAFAHGKSDGMYASLGLREAQDLRAWIDWILLQEPDSQIVVLGIDEGAAAALFALGGELPPAVCAVAADNAYSSLERRALQQLEEKLGSGGGDWMLFCAAYRLVHGMDIKSGDLMQRVSGVDRPLLLIHGTGDQQTPAWHSEDLKQAAGENARLLLIEGASHAMARFADPQMYYDVLLAFFAEALM